MGQFTLKRKSEITGNPEHSIGYYVLYNGEPVIRQQADEQKVPFETRDANFNPDYFEVMNNDEDRKTARAKFLKFRGEYVLGPDGNPYTVPYTFDFEAFIKKYQSFAAITPGTEGYVEYIVPILGNSFRPGGIDDLQRSYDGTHGYYQTPFMSFTASASFVYGVASSLMGLELDTCKWAGGKVNEVQKALGGNNNTTGEYGNNPNNTPNIEQGYKFVDWLRSPNSRINKADTNDITYDLTLSDWSAATTVNSVSATRGDATLAQVNGVEDSVNPGQTVFSFPNDVYPEESDQQETDAPMAKIIPESADLIKEFRELAEYYYGLYLGPGNRAWIVDEADEEYYYCEQVKKSAWDAAVATAAEEMSAYLSALAFAKETSNVEPTLSGGPLYANLASDYQMYSMGEPPVSSDPLSMLRRAIFGHDNLELANSQFKKAVDDTIYKDIYPLMLTLGQMGNTALAGGAGPYAPAVAAPGNFIIEVAKKKSENYDRSNYTWESAFIDAGKETGIDLVAGMGAEKMSKVIATKFSLPELTRFGLEQSLDYMLQKGIDQIMENSQK